ncbi:MAG: PAS domain S-box protein [Rhizobiaceae bacterium]
MTAAYSFIDIAVIDGVRQRFAVGDALLLLDEGLETVLWANGPGAEQFGSGDIESTVGTAAAIGAAAKRQIFGTSAYRGGPPGTAMVRLGGQVQPLQIQRLTLPDSTPAVLLASSRTGPAVHRGEGEIAALAISGFSEPGHFLAMVDQEAGVIASTPGFSSLGISREALAGFIADVRTERDRLVKRLVRGGVSSYPAGFARLREEPLLHLLVVVDEPVASSRDTDTLPGFVQSSARPLSAAEEPTQRADEPADAPKDLEPSLDEADRSVTSSSVDPADGSIAEPPEAMEPEAEADDELAAARSRPPVRFLWRTDPEGRFNAVSEEFVGAIGLGSDAITGRTFAEIATAIGLDPDEEISGLLARRDTWSGRSVMWPLGNGLSVPVDLAALPAYGRDRTFEGFRGFGVVRFADAVVAPAAAKQQDDADMFSVGADDDSDGALTDDEVDLPDLQRMDEPAPAAGDDPFRGEVPALKIEPPLDDKVVEDKVIRLAERRQPQTERALSNVERNAFREIGDRLRGDNEDARPPRPFGNRKPEDRPQQDEHGIINTQGAPAWSELVTRYDISDATNDEAESDEEQQAEQFISGSDAEADMAGDQPFEPPAPFDEANAEPLSPRPEQLTVVDDDPEIDRIEAETEPPAVADLFELAEQTSDLSASPSPSQAPDGEADTTDVADVAAVSGRDVLNRLPVPVLIHAGDTLHFANAEFLELTGYDSVEQLAEAGGLEALFSTYDGDGEKDEHQLHLRMRDGDVFPIEALLRSVPWGSGKALMLVVRRTGEDKPNEDGPALAEARIRISEMRAIIDTATDGVVLIDPDGSIRSISRPAEALFGFDNDDLAGKPFTSLFAIESQRAAREYLSGLSDHGVASVLNDGREVIGREAQGRFIPLFMTIGRLPNNSGFCAVVRDVTQWKRAEEELSQSRSQAEKASSQKTDFLARVSHEIRTPLNAIIGFSELMIDEKFGPIANDRYRDYLRDINRSGNHVLDLVNDLLDISKIEAGEQDMAYEAVSLNEALAEAVAIMQPQANRERVIIRSSFATRLPEVVADLRSIRQIALNVLSNAVRFTQAGGQVIISTAYEPNGDIALRVRDTGIGMSQAEIEQALKPFKQINALKRTRGDGTGLGLPLTKAMVEANRAKFTLTSAPGEGTLVEVVFPSTRVLAQ